MASGSIGYGHQHPSMRLYFDGEESNYEQWELKFLAYMKIQKLKDVINPDSRSITSEDQKESAFAQLVQYLDPRSTSLIMRDALNDGRKAMQILRDHYKGSTHQRAISMWNALSSLQKHPSEQLTDYIIRAETAATSLKSSGEIVSDTMLIAMVMKGLPPSYKPFIVFVTQSDKVMTFLQFKTSIRTFEENERASFHNAMNNTTKQFDGVMNVHQNNGKQQNRQYFQTDVRNAPSQGKQVGGVICNTCKGQGHKSDVCPTSRQNPNSDNKNRKQGGKKYCSHCNTNSHNTAACRKLKKVDNARTVQIRGGDQPQHLQQQQEGFMPLPLQHQQYFGEAQKPCEDTFPHNSLRSNQHSFVMHFNERIDEIKKEPPQCKDEIQPSIGSLLVDSGASSHIVVDTSKFVSFQDNFKPEEHSLEYANGNIEQVAERRGTILVHFKDEMGEIRDIYLEDTLYCPSFPQDIFSTKAALRKGGSVILRSKDGELITSDGTMFPINCSGELYHLDLYDNPAPVNTEVGDNYCIIDEANSCKPPSIRSASLEEWHHILGHVNTSDILKLEKAVSDMKITGKKDFPCSTCVLSKQPVFRSREPDERATAPLQFVHSDLAGPIEPVARDGMRYVINFVDDYTGACFVYFLRQKSDASTALEKFLCDIAPYGKVGYIITKFRSDNGGEFISREFEQTLIKNRIRHEFSAPHSPHQNGTAERNWRTLFEMARSMIIESGLPQSLWTYAVMASAHVRNRMYCQRIKGTPYHLLTGKKPAISKLHLFGSVCYAYEQQKKKLDPRCSEGLFVGYDKYSPSFLVYFPRTNTIGKYGTVKFTERFPSSPSRETNFYNSQSECHAEAPTYPLETMIQFYGNDSQKINDTVEVDVPRNGGDPVLENVSSELDNEDIPLLNPLFSNDEAVVEGADVEPENARPYNLRNRSKQHNDFANCIRDACYRVSNVPASYSQAIKKNDADQWQLAMESEMKSMEDNHVFTVVPLPEGKKVVGSRWVYSIKDNPDGNILHKARFVAKGFSQVEGSDYTDTYSPTAKMSTVRILMQLAVENDMTVHQLDVKTAYLNAPIDCEVYVQQPQGFARKPTSSNSTLVWKLHKSLYGLKQSGRNWNIVLSQFFQSHGFKQSKVDACLFVRCSKSGKLFIVIWVDDIVVAGHPKLVQTMKDLMKKEFKMTDLGNISYFLGIQFHQTSSCITMTQSHYLKGVLEKYGMAESKPRSTPCEPKPEAYKCEDDEVSTPEYTRKYREIVGSLVYAMTCSRPDLAWIVTKLSQHLACPTKIDWMMITHVLRYIKGTIDQRLTFKKSDKLEIIGFSDSDWASCKQDRKSTTGYCFTLNNEGPVVSWKSRKQQTVALSSCEAEYMALTNATQEALFLEMLLKDFGFESHRPISISGDNKGSIDLSKNSYR